MKINWKPNERRWRFGMNKRAGIILVVVSALTMLSVIWYGVTPRGLSLPTDVQRLLLTGEKFELFSLDPEVDDADSAESDSATVSSEANNLNSQPPKPRIHGWLVLGSVEIKDAKTRQELSEVLDRGVSEHRGSWATCFVPRHMIRITSGDNVTDILVCFHCRNATIYRNGARSKLFGISQLPKARFDQELTEAEIPLAP